MTSEKQDAGPETRRWLVFLPLAAFLALTAVFTMQLLSGRDTSIVPSALINKPAPETNLPPLAGFDLPGIKSENFKGRVTVLNVWASWCGPCRVEHPLVLELGKDDRFTLVGLNYKDKPENAAEFLNELGNSYDEIGVDANGRNGIDWGVYGVPETFVVGKDGTIRFKHVGPLTPESLANGLMPEIEKALTDG